MLFIFFLLIFFAVVAVAFPDKKVRFTLVINGRAKAEPRKVLHPIVNGHLEELEETP